MTIIPHKSLQSVSLSMLEQWRKVSVRQEKVTLASTQYTKSNLHVMYKVSFICLHPVAYYFMVSSVYFCAVFEAMLQKEKGYCFVEFLHCHL